MKQIEKISYWIVISILVIVAVLTAAPILPIPNNYQLLAVQSGSMEPRIPYGSVVVVQPTGDYEVNDVITFNPPDSGSATVTHRIVEATASGQMTTYTTKGDANEAEDRWQVAEADIVGRVLFTIPLAGHVVDFARTEIGLALLIVVPGTIIVYTELIKIKDEVKRLKSGKKKDEKQLATDKVEESE